MVSVVNFFDAFVRPQRICFRVPCGRSDISIVHCFYVSIQIQREGQIKLGNTKGYRFMWEMGAQSNLTATPTVSCVVRKKLN